MKHLEHTSVDWEAALKKLIADEGYPVKVEPAYGIIKNDPERIYLRLSTWVESFRLPPNFWERLMCVQKELDSKKC